MLQRSAKTGDYGRNCIYRRRPQYEEVKDDIYVWFPLVIEGGTVCGHDYYQVEQYVARSTRGGK